MWQHLTVLAQDIGPRVLGTENDRRGAAYIEEQFRLTGLEVTRDVYPCPSSDHPSTKLTVLPNRPLEGLANMFSPPGDVTGELVVIFPRLAAPTKEQVVGKVVLAPEIAGAVLERNALAEQLEAYGALALIGVSAFQDLPETKFFRTPELKRMPVVCVARRVGVELRRQVGERVRVQVEGARFDSESYNVIARKPGQGKSIVLGAHYDTAPVTGAASDNTSGTAVVIELARIIAREKTCRPYVFVAFGGEEYGGLKGAGAGATAYEELHGDEFDGIAVMMAIDLVGDPMVSNTLHYLENVPGSKAAAELVRDDPTLVLEADLRSGSDFIPFMRRGVPSLWMGMPWPGQMYHTVGDDLSQVHPQGLEEALRSALTICRGVDASDAF